MPVICVDGRTTNYDDQIALLKRVGTIALTGPQDGETCRTCGEARYIGKELLPHMLSCFWANADGSRHVCKCHIGPICERANCNNSAARDAVTVYSPGYLAVICTPCAAAWQARDPQGYEQALQDAIRFRYAEG